MAQRDADRGGQISGIRKTTRRAGRRAPQRLALCAVIALALAVSARPSDAATMDRAGEIGAAVFDLAVLRPLHGAAVVLGTVFFAASAPIVAAGNAATGDWDFPAVRTAFWDVFVYPPYEYAVLRDIGDF